MCMKDNVGLNTDGRKPRVVDDMYRSTLVKGDNVKAKIHPNNKAVPKTSDKGGRKNQYGENRRIAG